MNVLEEFDAINARLDRIEREILTYRQGLTTRYEQLQHEAEVQKKLSRYARRTWFEMMAYIFIVGMLLSDVARAYADNRWWGLLFWTTQHGNGGADEWVLRAIGFVWQVVLFIVLGKRSQVPDSVFDRVAHAEVERTRLRRKR